MNIKERPVLFLFFMLLCTMSVVSVLAENNPSSECQCANEPKVCNQYTTDNTCVDRLPNLASPLDETPDIISKKYDYYNFGSEWTATYCGGKPKRHVGADLGVEFVEGKGIPVYAAASGQVKANYLCSSSYDWAKGIVLDHDGAFTTVYEHINPLVSVGQHVDKGQQIATLAKIEGNYQHLHFGIKCGGYEAISTRGALPVEHGPCDKKIDCSTSGCRCDPLFPGPFIDPLDGRIVYEKHNPPQESIQFESFSDSLNLDLPTIPSESALSTTPMLDGIHPTVQAFQVTTQSLAVDESFTIEYTVSDTEGSGLNRVELWRKDEQSDWQEINRDALSGGDGPTSGSFLDVPSNSGKYWYGIHVADNSGYWNDEQNSNSDNKPGVYGPIEVDVTESQSGQVLQGAIPVTLTLYVHDGSADGPVISDALVEGQDGSGNTFQQTTDSSGYVTIEGDSGTWSFSVSADGYETNNWDQEITETETDSKDVFLQKVLEIATSPLTAEDWVSKGDDLSVNGHYDEEALHAYDMATQIDPNHADAWAKKGLYFDDHGKYDEAVQAYDKATQINPQSKNLWDLKGIALFHQGKYDKAIQAFDRATEIEPLFVDAYYRKGECLKAAGRTTEASAAFAKAKAAERELGL